MITISVFSRGRRLAFANMVSLEIERPGQWSTRFAGVAARTDALPKTLFKYGNGSELLLNHADVGIWWRSAPGQQAKQVVEDRPRCPVAARRFWSPPSGRPLYIDAELQLRLERILEDFVCGRAIWDLALPNGPAEPAKGLRALQKSKPAS
jgi:hypothetical protein